MIQVNGKHNHAIIYTDVVDEASIAQVQELCNQEFTASQRIRLMSSTMRNGAAMPSLMTEVATGLQTRISMPI